ncbi:MAG TPA: M1 family metallopeptidase [Bryobacteraceae bacterium]|jgi:aminopeptidase N|nr:M1 family metallopeptidase [Bryobacteraceae bacterium]
MTRRTAIATITGSTLALAACHKKRNMEEVHDIDSFAHPTQVRVKHCSLDLTVNFHDKKLEGSAGLNLVRTDPKAPLILDTRDLHIDEVRCGKYQDGAPASSYAECKFTIGNRDPILGSPLTVNLPAGTDYVLIQYASQPEASGLQWLEPHQTAGRRHPFLYSQNESIHARSWIPIQDTPSVRLTYDATIRIQANYAQALIALMGAEHQGSGNGVFRFSMDLPIPSYLIALAVGELHFRDTGQRSGVYAEPPIIDSATREFADTEKLMEAVEDLYGPYRWGRYDLLILPPSFPFGGMENPRLTFATPTVIAGDKSLVSLVAHELAHSWSGNLVTNATWSDFWLNEGFTTYIENRIQERVYGQEVALMEQVLDRRVLDKELREFDKRDQILHIDLAGRDPDDTMSEIPYFKGALFLRQMEEVFGRPTFDEYLKKYFNHFAFQSITTATALDYLRTELLGDYPRKAKQIPVNEWVYQPGLPAPAPQAVSERLNAIRDKANQWAAHETSARDIDTANWVTQEWLEFLQVLPNPLPPARMTELDQALHLTRTGNDEILDQWLLMSIDSGYTHAFPRLEGFLLHVGRIKYIRPLYVALMKTPKGQARAKEIYRKARPGYHPIAQAAIDKIVK